MPSLREVSFETRREANAPAFSSAAADGQSRIDHFLQNHAGHIAIGLSMYAALRILILIAAFPLFNNVDEKFHFMSIEMYAQGHLPGKELPLIDDQFSRRFLPYWSPEYDSPQVLKRYGIVAPLYPLSAEAQDVSLARGYYAWKRERWSRTPNFEAQGAPLYYLVGAGWYKLGTVFGFRGWSLAYWLRLLNPIAYGVFVWFSYKFVRRVYPERPFLQVAVAALLAVFPNDVLFGLNRDILSPLLGGLVLVLMVDSVAKRENGSRPLIIASFLVGLAFVLEVSNCVFYGALAATLWTCIRRASIGLKIRTASFSVGASFILPVLWMVRNYLVIGDLTGSREKLRWFGWTLNTPSEMFKHPLFTAHGVFYFFVNLVRDFWQGEIKWYGQPMRSPVADKFYILSTGVLFLVFALHFIGQNKAMSDLQRWTGWQSMFLVASASCFLAAISLPFDYHDFGYPSRLHPFFISGRIILGTLLPFALIYMSALEALLRPFRRWFPPLAVLACLLVFISFSEMRVRSVVFHSPYNLFALLSHSHE